MMFMNKAVFLDRDGTIIEDKNYIYEFSKVTFLPNAIKALEIFQKRNFLLIIVSNQSGVGRGFFSENDVRSVNEYINQKLLECGIYISNFYYCPHYLGSRNAIYNKACNCRKPAPGLILQAAYEHNIDLNSSYMFGDKVSDVLAGLNAGVDNSYIVNKKHNLFFYAKRM